MIELMMIGSRISGGNRLRAPGSFSIFFPFSGCHLLAIAIHVLALRLIMPNRGRILHH